MRNKFPVKVNVDVKFRKAEEESINRRLAGRSRLSRCLNHRRPSGVKVVSSPLAALEATAQRGKSFYCTHRP